MDTIWALLLFPGFSFDFCKFFGVFLNKGRLLDVVKKIMSVHNLVWAFVVLGLTLGPLFRLLSSTCVPF